MADNGSRKMKERSAFVYCAWPVSGKEAATTLKAARSGSSSCCFSAELVLCSGSSARGAWDVAEAVCARGVRDAGACEGRARLLPSSPSYQVPLLTMARFV